MKDYFKNGGSKYAVIELAKTISFSFLNFVPDLFKNIYNIDGEVENDESTIISLRRNLKSY